MVCRRFGTVRDGMEMVWDDTIWYGDGMGGYGMGRNEMVWDGMVTV